MGKPKDRRTINFDFDQPDIDYDGLAAASIRAVDLAPMCAAIQAAATASRAALDAMPTVPALMERTITTLCTCGDERSHVFAIGVPWPVCPGCRLPRHKWNQ